MATLREIRGRISGVKKTQKITKAMKMVAAAKLRRAQANVIAARPYAGKMKELLEFLSGTVDVSLNPLMSPREVRSGAVVVVTADRGLCGAFNTNLIKAAVAHCQQAFPPGGPALKVVCIGRKGADYFSRRNYTMAGKHIGVYAAMSFARAQTITRELVDGYLAGEYDRVDIVYNEFKSVAQSRITVEQFLPIPKPVASEQHADYIFEPSAQDIINALVPRHLSFQIWKVLLESNAAEEGSRMAAMENATENANELISVLELQYNKARQAAITKELLEVVSGAEALKKAG